MLHIRYFTLAKHAITFNFFSFFFQIDNLIEMLSSANSIRRKRNIWIEVSCSYLKLTCSQFIHSKIRIMKKFLSPETGSQNIKWSVKCICISIISYVFVLLFLGLRVFFSLTYMCLWSFWCAPVWLTNRFTTATSINSIEWNVCVNCMNTYI